jgi:hypothetical protein
MYIKKLFLYCFIPLFIGGIIYIGYRTESLLMFEWFKFIGLIKIVVLFRTVTIQIYMPDFVVYSLPNGP